MSANRPPTYPAVLLAAVLAAFVLAGCTDPDAPTRANTTSTSTPTVQEPGEPSAPAAQRESAAASRQTAQAAIAAFAKRYMDWSYRSLAADQRTLAAMAVGAARLSEQRAASASAADETLAEGQIWNRGRVVSIAPDHAQPGTWALVTREETGGKNEYAGLPPAYHVTLAKLTHTPQGYAISEWLPQS